MIQPATIRFLKDLKNNNNKPWFDANRDRYTVAKADFENFIDQVIKHLGKQDISILNLKAKDCMFRINRDVRFSKDKSPYKTNFGASINADGKKSLKAGYYFHLEPGESFAGGGLWQPASKELQRVRQEIDYNLNDFRKIINGSKFKKYYPELYASEGQLLSRLPKGYDTDNPAAEYLKYKSYLALTNISDDELTNAKLLQRTVQAFTALMPMVTFLNTALHE